jgi:hypothetical protein
MMAGLLGNSPTRHFKVYRTKFPAIFRFNGKLYMEHYNIDQNVKEWIQIEVAEAERWLKPSPPQN